MNARRPIFNALVAPFAGNLPVGHDEAKQLLDAYRAEVLREAADLITSAQEQIERDEMAEHGFLDHETVLQRDAVHYMAKLLRTKADEATPGGAA